MTQRPITVTRPWLPPFEEYVERLRGVWERNHLTNSGPLAIELEERLQDYLGAPNLRLVANGMLGLQLALRALDVSGDVITTPFSYVATTGVLLWERCRPVFVDVRADTLCIDASKIEERITPRTSAILATHVYGFPCDVEAIQTLAVRHNLKVIYDGAHAFGVRLNGKPICAFGDATVLSFHATKLFQTVEGGAVVMRDAENARRVSLMRSFGHLGDEHISIGINAKASEPHAAMGLCLLPRVAQLMAERRRVSEHYDSVLRDSSLEFPTPPPGAERNYAYYPVLFADEPQLLAVAARLAAAGVSARRYFYPSLNELPYLADVERSSCPISESAARRVLCLPFYPGLAANEVERIARCVLEGLERG